MIPASAPANLGLLKTPLVEAGGFLHVPQWPGIGVEVDEEGGDTGGRRLQGGQP